MKIRSIKMSTGVAAFLCIVFGVLVISEYANWAFGIILILLGIFMAYKAFFAR